MAKVTGRKRHWSQSALRGVGAAFGAGRKVRQRVRRAVIRGGKRIISRLNRKKRGLNKKSDVLGTFVKCKDFQVKGRTRALKRHEKFAKKVNSVVYSNIPKNTELYSYAWQTHTPTTDLSNAAVKWFQFAVDPLNCESGSSNTGNCQLSAEAQVAGTNPAGVTRVLLQENAFGSTVAGAYGPTVMSSITDITNGTGALRPTGNANMETAIRQGPTHMRVQFKNVKSFGITIEIMLVKPKTKIGVSAFSKKSSMWQTDGAVSSIALAPTGWATTSPNNMTPLELAQMGLARKSFQSGQGVNMWTNPMVTLQDSSDFNEHYRMTHRCKVYVPPGGVVEKSVYHKGSRIVKSAHLSDYLHDTRTTFMVCKYIPEVQLVSIGAQPTAGLPEGDLQNGSPVDLVGTVNFRTSFKQFVTTTQSANMYQYNRQVISHNLVAGGATSIYSKI